jgi:CRISPR-associated exonuclease Cas4
MEEPISISNLNDFIFCPVSIYFHRFYQDLSTLLYQDECQLGGTHIHQKIDSGGYSTRRTVLQGIGVYSERFHLTGKIDVFDVKTGVLTERKKKITVIYDGYVFQVYAQCFGLRDAGYQVNKIRLYSYDDNRNFDIPLPEDDPAMLAKFEKTIESMHTFQLEDFEPVNPKKCANCIYHSLCDRSLIV